MLSIPSRGPVTPLFPLSTVTAHRTADVCSRPPSSLSSADSEESGIRVDKRTPRTPLVRADFDEIDDDNETADEHGFVASDAGGSAIDSARSWLSDAENDLAEWAASTPRPEEAASGAGAVLSEQLAEWIQSSPRLHHQASSVHNDGSSSVPTSARRHNDGSNSARGSGSHSARGSSARRLGQVLRAKTNGSPTVATNSPLAKWFSRQQEDAKARSPQAIEEDSFEAIHANHPGLHIEEDGSVFL